LAATSTIAAGTNKTTQIKGDWGNWAVQTSYQALEDATRLSTNKMERTLFKALSAVASNVPADFAKCFFANITTNNSPSASDLFEEWKAATANRNKIVLGATASLLGDQSNSTNRWTACVVLFLQGGQLRVVDTRVMIFREEAGISKFLLQTQDVTLASHLSEIARLPFESAPSTPEAVRQLIERQRQVFLEHLARTGTREQVIATIERNQLIDTSARISDWDSWCKHYQAQVLNPPIVFDVNEPIQPDYSTPIAALKSYEHAMQKEDVAELLQHADDSGKKRLREFTGEPTQPRIGFNKYFAKFTKATILLTARAVIAGNEYTLLLQRRETPVDPKKNLVRFEGVVFRKNLEGYLFSNDMANSELAQLLYYAKAEPGMGLNPDFFKQCQKSLLPPHFYTLP
jgi:hypothetical protein